MAITRISGLHTIKTVSNTLHSLDRDAFTLQRLSNGRIAATFETNGSGSAETAYITTLDKTGATHSSILTLDKTSNGRILEDPTIAAGQNGRFFVVWNNAGNSSDITKSDALGRVFRDSGSAVTSKFQLSSHSSDGELIPSVAALSNGNFFTAWTDTRGAPLSALDADILDRVWRPSGSAATGESKVNTNSSGVQVGTQALALADGRSVVIWHHGVRTGIADVDSIDTRGRFIDAKGKLTGKEFSVDTIGSGRNYDPENTELVNLGNGGFAMVWIESIGPISGPKPKEIHFQRFDDDGHKLGSEKVIEKVPSGSTFLWSTTVELANGGFAVLWRTFDPGPGAGKVLVRQFTMNGTEIGHETELTPIAQAGGGLKQVVDLELMSNGHILGIGEAAAPGKLIFGTQEFDFGDERLKGGTKADTLYGKNAVDDQILGLAGNDTIDAKSGNDIIAGGSGRDKMKGGLGSDDFVFKFVSDSGKTATTRDIISDFKHGADDIDISALSGTYTFIATKGAGFTGAGHEVRWSQVNVAGTAHDRTVIDVDVDGDKASDFQIELTGLVTLTKGDFIL